ncbi:MAG TPA: DUF1501 domain-containing protein [Steroidobacteraceae bacterium]|nr:DUF1501 domain-containing protein [Steroidobacteraceae bacterium]
MSEHTPRRRPSMLERRELLRLLGGAALTAPLLPVGRLYAAPLTGPRFLLVFLRGGYDAANFLIPYASDFYYESRPRIAIARPDPAAGAGALALDASWALAPAVRDTIGTLYQQRQALFIPFAGTDDLSRSHFETQDSIELGQPSQGRRNYSSGFLGRLSQALTGTGAAAPIAFTDALPLVFQGGPAIPNLSLRNVGKAAFDERQSQLLDRMYAGHRLEPAVRDGLELRQEVAQEMAQEMQAANRNAINAKGFELEAERMGRLMRERFRLGFIDVGGWDTHVNEGATQGALAGNLSNLGRGLATFAETLGTEWRNTVVVVVSEFGRTFRENGNRGTDHGHGSVYWVLGGAVAGGRIAGEQQRIARDTLFQDRDYPVLNDYRAILAGLFRTLWGLSAAQCAGVFPSTTPLELGLV